MKQFLRTHNRILFVGYSAVIVILLLIAMTAFWLQSTLFDTTRFTSIAREAVTSQSSRDSIARKAVETSLADRPLIRATLGPKLEKTVSNVLGSEFADRTFMNVIEKMQLLLTTPRHDPIVIDLTSIKAIAQRAQNVTDNAKVDSIDIENVPDSIMIIDTAKIPNLYQYSVWVLWTGPIALIVAALLSFFWIYRGGRAFYLYRLTIIAGVFVITGVLAALVGPLVRPAALSIAPDVSTQTLLGNVYNGFIGPFTNLACMVAISALVVGLFALLIGFFVRHYRVTFTFMIRKIKK